MSLSHSVESLHHHHTYEEGDGVPDKGPGSKSGGKKPKGGTKAGGGKKKK